MEVKSNSSILFLGILITKVDSKLKTQVYRKPIDNGSLLHFQSLVDNRHKNCFVNTMVDLAYCLISYSEAFSTECKKRRCMFSKLCYPISFVESTIQKFSQDQTKNQVPLTANENEHPPGYSKIPYKDQTSADKVLRDLNSLSCKSNVNVKAVFNTSKELDEILSTRERKPPIVNNQHTVLSIFFSVACAM